MQGMSKLHDELGTRGQGYIEVRLPTGEFPLLTAPGSLAIRVNGASCSHGMISRRTAHDGRPKRASAASESARLGRARSQGRSVGAADTECHRAPSDALGVEGRLNPERSPRDPPRCLLSPLMENTPAG